MLVEALHHTSLTSDLNDIVLLAFHPEKFCIGLVPGILQFIKRESKCVIIHEDKNSGD